MERYTKKGYYDEGDYAKRSMVSGACSIVSNICFWIVFRFMENSNIHTDDIVGMLGYLFFFVMFCVSIFVFAIKAISYHKKAGDDFNSSLANAGMICGILGIVIGVGPLLYTLAYCAAFVLFGIVSPGPWLPS